jgi:hypothetical protein
MYEVILKNTTPRTVVVVKKTPKNPEVFISFQ